MSHSVNEVRYFLGIAFSAAVRKELRHFAPARSRRVRPTAENKLHLTLHFLGALNKQQVAAVVAEMQHFRAGTFSLTIAGGGQFPDRGRPRILWAGVESSAALSNLHVETTALLARAIDFVSETRPYRPHITLARCHGPMRQQELEYFQQHAEQLKIANIPVESVVLFCSQPQQQNTGYGHTAHVRLR